MDVAVVDRFVALLTLGAIAVVAIILGLRVAGRRSGAAAVLRDRLDALLAPGALWMAWMVAAGSMLGSLYYSEVVNYPPCGLCWYQRIAMYPLVVILAIAAWRRDERIRSYALSLVVVGAVIALYQYVLGYIPDAGVIGCTIDGVSCTERFVWEFGFIDFPFMSLVAFALIGSLLSFVTSPEVDAE